jgi:hypothetical protein
MKKLLDSNLENACTIISFMIAMAFLKNGKPSKKILEAIIEGSAKPMAKMRRKLSMKPELFEDVDIYDFMDALIAWCDGDDKSEFKKTFPLANREWFANNKEVAEDINLDWSNKLKAGIETALRLKQEVACSILFEGHVITGCFDRQVRYNTFPNPEISITRITRNVCPLS